MDAFRPGQWVTYRGQIGILHHRIEFAKNERGQIVDRENNIIDTADDYWHTRAARFDHIDFHPVDPEGNTIDAGIVRDFITGGVLRNVERAAPNRIVSQGESGLVELDFPSVSRRAIGGIVPPALRIATIEEIPVARVPHEARDGVMRAFGYPSDALPETDETEK